MTMEDPADLLVREQRTFEKAKTYLKPSGLFRKVVFLYAERKLLVLLCVQFMATVITWMHYSVIKWEMKQEEIADDEPHAWLKRIGPTFAFGSKHAILLQAALLPLTMARFSIASLTESIVERFVPLNRMYRMHMVLGYTMVGITVFATILFILFFGSLCAAGEEAYCKGLRSEIMMTGFVITAILLAVAGTSLFRNRIAYEIFYAVHHLVFILYGITILHTFDWVQRRHVKSRYQTFGWLLASILFYACDRAIMRVNHKYRMRLVSSATVTGKNGCHTVLLKLKRSVLFDFKPGQYAYVRLAEIDKHFHPFTIASGPDSTYLEFYIEVFQEGSWTWKLWDLLKKVPKADELRLEFEVMGPYGTSLGRIEDYSHALAIGSGTGIVPVLSLFKQHVHQLAQLDPLAHSVRVASQEKQIMKIEKASSELKGSMAAKLVGCCFGVKRTPNRRDSIKQSIVRSIEMYDQFKSRDIDVDSSEMKQAAFHAIRSIYGVVILAILPVVGVSLIGWTISWNILPFDIYPGMRVFLQALTILFEIAFAFVAIFVWDANQLSAYTDLTACLLAPLADWWWFGCYDRHVNLTPGEITSYCLFIAYMTLRAWSATVRPRHRAWRSRDGSTTLDRLDLVWVTRSACQAAEILPEINVIYEGIAALWGEAKADQVCRVRVHVTDKDNVSNELLRDELKDMALYKKGFIHFGRPDFRAIIESHSLELISTRRNSYSLLAFCGSPVLGHSIHEAKIENDMIVAMTGNKKHQMEYVSESYGGTSPSKSKPKMSKDEEKTVSPSSRSVSSSISSAGAESDQKGLTRRFDFRCATFDASCASLSVLEDTRFP